VQPIAVDGPTDALPPNGRRSALARPTAVVAHGAERDAGAGQRPRHRRASCLLPVGGARIEVPALLSLTPKPAAPVAVHECPQRVTASWSCSWIRALKSPYGGTDTRLEGLLELVQCDATSPSVWPCSFGSLHGWTPGRCVASVAGRAGNAASPPTQSSRIDLRNASRSRSRLANCSQGSSRRLP
jgi:hypothetical protein